MVKISSNKATVYKNIKEVYDFLCVPSNYEVLMPSKVRSFSSTDNGATLDIEGVGNVELAITEQQEPTLIVMEPQNRVPFKFNIQWVLGENEGSTDIQAFINAELNSLMKMMAEKLLKDFLDVQVDKLTKELV